MSSLHHHVSNSNVRITITGGAGRIAYSLFPLILNGLIFGPERKIHLTLLDIPDMSEKLAGIAMEIHDSNYRLLDDIVVTTNANDAFHGTDIAILLGGFPRLPGMERKDLLIKNAENIRSQAEALNNSANSNVKCLIVANPANTNCLVAIKTADKIPSANFTCLTRLDEERLRHFCSQKASTSLNKRVTGHDIQNVYILGNHSTTQVAHIEDGRIGPNQKISTCFNDDEYDELLKRVQNRGAEIINATKVSSACSAAEAIVKHLRDWLGHGSASGPFSMGVYSHGNPYGVDEDLVFSFPCVRSYDDPSGYRILHGISLNEKTKELVKKTENELVGEKEQIREFL
jgi:malate dehydrogenase